MCWWKRFSWLDVVPKLPRQCVFWLSCFVCSTGLLLYSVPMEPFLLSFGIVLLQSVEIFALAIVLAALYEYAYERTVLHGAIRKAGVAFTIGTLVADIFGKL